MSVSHALEIQVGVRASVVWGFSERRAGEISDGNIKNAGNRQEDGE